ncbi:hypothetical protein ABIC08_006343 [Bradyrhizobium sp. RT9b]
MFEKAEEMVCHASELSADVVAHCASEGSIVGPEAKELPNGAIVAKLDKVQTDLLQKIAAAGTHSASTGFALGLISGFGPSRHFACAQ